MQDIRDYYNLKNLVRYNQRIRLKDESVAEHSYYVALYTEFICKELKLCNATRLVAIQYALLHDIPEIYTSDIPHPIKSRSPELRTILQGIEYDILRDHFTEYLPLIQGIDQEESFELIRVIVETADVLSVIQYTKQEITLGNQTMQEIYDSSLLRYRHLHRQIYELTNKRLVLKF